MSARKIAGTGHLQQVTVHQRQTRLNLTDGSIVIHKNGIEFRSTAPLSPWTEMTLTLQSPGESRLHCNGVVISCTGNKHTGYHISLVFTALSRQAQAWLSTRVHTQAN